MQVDEHEGLPLLPSLLVHQSFRSCSLRYSVSQDCAACMSFQELTLITVVDSTWTLLILLRQHFDCDSSMCLSILGFVLLLFEQDRHIIPEPSSHTECEEFAGPLKRISVLDPESHSAIQMRSLISLFIFASTLFNPVHPTSTPQDSGVISAQSATLPNDDPFYAAPAGYESAAFGSILRSWTAPRPITLGSYSIIESTSHDLTLDRQHHPCQPQRCLPTPLPLAKLLGPDYQR